MIGLDTNVLVRYIMQDDPQQSARATRVMESLSAEAPGFVPLVAVVELVWVLSSAYRLNPAQVAQALEALLLTKEVIVDQAETVWKALRAFRDSRADFADCLIAQTALAAGCERTLTFDRVAAVEGHMSMVA